MKRREFFKNTGLIAGGLAAAGGITFNKLNHPNFSKESGYEYLPAPRPGHLTRLEIMITHHCNLNCAYCDHCSPIAPPFFYPLDKYEKDIKKLKEITKAKIYQIALLGGEPLLSKDIEEYVKITRKYFKNSVIAIETNGILLNNMKDSFWKTCSENKIKIQYTYYPLYKNYPNLKESYAKAEKYGVLITSITRYVFALSNFKKDRNQDIKKIYAKCKEKEICASLANGILYACPHIAGVQFFNEYYKDYALKVDKKDYLVINEINSMQEIIDFYKKPKEFCKNCGVIFPGIEMKKNRKVWAQSQNKLSEWYDV